MSTWLRFARASYWFTIAGLLLVAGVGVLTWREALICAGVGVWSGAAGVVLHDAVDKRWPEAWGGPEGADEAVWQGLVFGLGAALGVVLAVVVGITNGFDVVAVLGLLVVPAKTNASRKPGKSRAGQSRRLPSDDVYDHPHRLLALATRPRSCSPPSMAQFQATRVHTDHGRIRQSRAIHLASARPRAALLARAAAGCGRAGATGGS